MKNAVLVGLLIALPAPVLLAQGAPGAKTDRPAPVIGYLKTRHHTIALLAGGRYTIATRDGKTLARNVTRKQLQASDPSLHRLLERAVAAKVWAGP